MVSPADVRAIDNAQKADPIVVDEACVTSFGVDVAVIGLNAEFFEGEEVLSCGLVDAVEVCSERVGCLLVVEDGVVFRVAEPEGLVEIHR